MEFVELSEMSTATVNQWIWWSYPKPAESATGPNLTEEDRLSALFAMAFRPARLRNKERKTEVKVVFTSERKS